MFADSLAGLYHHIARHVFAVFEHFSVNLQDLELWTLEKKLWKLDDNWQATIKWIRPEKRTQVYLTVKAITKQKARHLTQKKRTLPVAECTYRLRS